jgi:hypothetical protein
LATSCSLRGIPIGRLVSVICFSYEQSIGFTRTGEGYLEEYLDEYPFRITCRPFQVSPLPDIAFKQTCVSQSCVDIYEDRSEKSK